MADETTADLGAGLSEEEKEDLENLVRALKQDESGFPSGQGLEDIHTQVASVSERLAEFGEMILKLDSRMKSFYEMVRLFHQKSEIMNKRIDSIIESMKGEKGP